MNGKRSGSLSTLILADWKIGYGWLSAELNLYFISYFYQYTSVTLLLHTPYYIPASQNAKYLNVGILGSSLSPRYLPDVPFTLLSSY